MIGESKKFQKRLGRPGQGGSEVGIGFMIALESGSVRTVKDK